MARPIIEARGLGKEYRLGARGPYRTLRESIVRRWGWFLVARAIRRA